MMITDLELLPCPFCGESLYLARDHHDYFWAHPENGCFNVVAQVYDQETYDRWNRPRKSSKEEEKLESQLCFAEEQAKLAAELIESHWQLFCDQEGYGPQGLLDRLRKVGTSHYDALVKRMEKLVQENLILKQQGVSDE